MWALETVERAGKQQPPRGHASTSRPRSAAGAVLALQRTVGNAAVAGVLSVQRSAKPTEVATQPVVDNYFAMQRLRLAWQLIQDEVARGRGGPWMQSSVQRAATATGVFNNQAPKPNAVAAPGVTSTVNWANVRAISNTSTAMDSADLRNEQTGAGVGATRPNHWWTFVAMLGGNHPFVQGHTLHQDLGGDGNHDNLSPFTHSSNGLHFHRAESEVLDQTDAGARDEYADYDVDLNYAGNAGIAVWALARFNAMNVNLASAAMVQAGLLTAPQAAACVLAGALGAGNIALAHAWLTTYVNNTFPTDFDCYARFTDDDGLGGYDGTAHQHVNITNDM